MKGISGFIVFLFSFSLAASTHVNCFQRLTALSSHNVYFNEQANNIQGISFRAADSFEALEQAYGGYAFFDLQYWLSSVQIQVNNRIISKLVKAQERSKGTSLAQVQDIYHLMLNRNAVLKEGQYEELMQHNCLETGFCFGRATFAHMEALMQNISEQFIKKIWVVGEMKEWTFHVATMILAEGRWMVLDNKVGLMSVQRWMKEMRKKLIGGKQMFFVSQPSRFGVNSPHQYNAIDLFGVNEQNDFYQGYFREYFQEVDVFVP